MIVGFSWSSGQSAGQDDVPSSCSQLPLPHLVYFTSPGSQLQSLLQWPAVVLLVIGSLTKQLLPLLTCPVTGSRFSGGSHVSTVFLLFGCCSTKSPQTPVVGSPFAAHVQSGLQSPGHAVSFVVSHCSDCSILLLPQYPVCPAARRLSSSSILQCGGYFAAYAVILGSSCAGELTMMRCVCVNHVNVVPVERSVCENPQVFAIVCHSGSRSTMFCESSFLYPVESLSGSTFTLTSPAGPW